MEQGLRAVVDGRASEVEALEPAHARVARRDHGHQGGEAGRIRAHDPGRAYKAALREAERARKAEERAAKAAARADVALRKQLQKEAKQAHVAAMEAIVAEKNTELAEIFTGRMKKKLHIIQVRTVCRTNRKNSSLKYPALRFTSYRPEIPDNLTS